MQTVPSNPRRGTTSAPLFENEFSLFMGHP
jgi:hypothetical protein